PLGTYRHGLEIAWELPQARQRELAREAGMDQALQLLAQVVEVGFGESDQRRVELGQQRRVGGERGLDRGEALDRGGTQTPAGVLDKRFERGARSGRGVFRTRDVVERGFGDVGA